MRHELWPLTPVFFVCTRCTVTEHRLVRVDRWRVAYCSRAERCVGIYYREQLPMSEIRIRDQAGWQWEVVESSKRRGTDGTSDRQRTLYFLNRYETRRIDEFPADWKRKTPKELIELCEVAEPL